MLGPVERYTALGLGGCPAVSALLAKRPKAYTSWVSLSALPEADPPITLPEAASPLIWVTDNWVAPMPLVRT